MFNHPHHQKISFILDSLETEHFLKAGAFFGRGTLITLVYNEYRFSKDIDFICPVGEGYRFFREIIVDASFDPAILFKPGVALEFPREIGADQYGIRFPVCSDDFIIKFEIVTEARIQLEAPDRFPWTELPCLSETDRFAEKLLANADRGLDSAIESRDLIDLAAMRVQTQIPTLAIDKAERAYPVIEPLKKSIANFHASKDYRNKCFDALQITDRKMILDGLDLLAKDQGLPLFERTWQEE